jgi:hypothetical protein
MKIAHFMVEKKDGETNEWIFFFFMIAASVHARLSVEEKALGKHPPPQKKKKGSDENSKTLGSVW